MNSGSTPIPKARPRRPGIAPGWWIGAFFLAAGVAGVTWLTRTENLAAYSESLRAKFPSVRFVTTAELQHDLDRPTGRIWLLDVRAEEEFAVSHLPGSVRADSAEQLRTLGVGPEDAVVVYCSVGYRSAIVAEKLGRSGFSNVRNLEGSIFAWANEARPLVDSHGLTEGVHPYDRRWGCFLEDSRWQWKPDEE